MIPQVFNHYCRSRYSCPDYIDGRGCYGCNNCPPESWNTIPPQQIRKIGVWDGEGPIPAPEPYIPQYDYNVVKAPKVVFRDGHCEYMTMWKPGKNHTGEFSVPSGHYMYMGEIFKFHIECIKPTMSIYDEMEFDLSDCWIPTSEIAGIEGIKIDFVTIDWDTEDYTD